jgi:hypothetical protein
MDIIDVFRQLPRTIPDMGIKYFASKNPTFNIIILKNNENPNIKKNIGKKITKKALIFTLMDFIVVNVAAIIIMHKYIPFTNGLL